MQPNCATSQAELNHDMWAAQATSSAVIEAKAQLTQVRAMANHLLSGKSFTDVRAKYNGPQVVGSYSVTYSFKNIGDLVSEELTDDLLKKLHAGDQSGIFEMQKLIGDCAHRIAFDALNLWGSPFTDYEDLRSTAEECA